MLENKQPAAIEVVDFIQKHAKKFEILDNHTIKVITKNREVLFYLGADGEIVGTVFNDIKEEN